MGIRPPRAPVAQVDSDQTWSPRASGARSLLKPRTCTLGGIVARMSPPAITLEVQRVPRCEVDTNPSDRRSASLQIIDPMLTRRTPQRKVIGNPEHAASDERQGDPAGGKQRHAQRRTQRRRKTSWHRRETRCGTAPCGGDHGPRVNCGSLAGLHQRRLTRFTIHEAGPARKQALAAGSYRCIAAYQFVVSNDRKGLSPAFGAHTLDCESVYPPHSDCDNAARSRGC